MIIPDKPARSILNHCVCARCKGVLDGYAIANDPEHIDVLCHTGCESGTGFVSKYWKKHLEDRDTMNYFEAKAALAGAIAWMRPATNKTADELLKELGF